MRTWRRRAVFCPEVYFRLDNGLGGSKRKSYCQQDMLKGAEVEKTSESIHSSNRSSGPRLGDARVGSECNPRSPARVYPNMEVILLVLGGTGVVASIGCAIWLLDKRERVAQQQRHERAEAERALSERIGRPSGEA